MATQGSANFLTSEHLEIIRGFVNEYKNAELIPKDFQIFPNLLIVDSEFKNSAYETGLYIQNQYFSEMPVRNRDAEISLSKLISETAVEISPTEVFLIKEDYPEVEFTDEKLDSFFKNLNSLFTNGVTVILSISKEHLESLNKKDENLVWRMFPDQISLSWNSEMACDNFFFQMEKYGFKCSDDFKKDMLTYVQTIYPTAALKESPDAFIKDLMARVFRTIARSDKPSDELTKENVPYYAKKQEEKKTVPAFHLDELKDSIKLPKIENQNTTKENVLLMALSTLPWNKSVSMWYKDENKKIGYPYLGQLEPVPQYLASLVLSGNNEYIDRIILLCTSETKKDHSTFVLDNGEEKVMTTEEYYKYWLKKWMNPKTPEAERFISIDLDEDHPAKAIYEAITVVKNLEKSHRARIQEEVEEHFALYIDEHGSFRSISLLTEAMASLIKDNIPVQVLSAHYDNKTKETVIKEKFEAFKIFDFVSGINEFVNYGRIDSLDQFYKEETADNLPLDGMRTIAEGLQLCDTQKFDQGLVSLKNWLDKFEETGEESTTSESLYYIRLFKDTIENDYGNLLTEDHHDAYSTISRIRWCLRKGFIQQALTYVENDLTPVYFTKGFFTPTYLSRQVGIGGIDTITAKYPPELIQKIIIGSKGYGSFEYNVAFAFLRLLYNNTLKNDEDFVKIVNEVFKEQTETEKIIKREENLTKLKKHLKNHPYTIHQISTYFVREKRSKEEQETDTSPLTEVKTKYVVGTTTEANRWCFYLHYLLKEERNSAAHADVTHVRRSSKEVTEIISFYLDLLEQILPTT